MNGGPTTTPADEMVQRLRAEAWTLATGEWFRKTPNGDVVDQVLDRFAEDYVNERKSLDQMISALDRYCERRQLWRLI